MREGLQEKGEIYMPICYFFKKINRTDMACMGKQRTDKSYDHDAHSCAKTMNLKWYWSVDMCESFLEVVLSNKMPVHNKIY